MKKKIKQILSKRWSVDFFDKLSTIIKGFSISEKLFFYFLCIVFICSGLVILNKANSLVTVQVPTNGGYLSEGIIGSPRFVNPVLAVSDVDHDLTALIYSGLMKLQKDLIQQELRMLLPLLMN